MKTNRPSRIIITAWDTFTGEWIAQWNGVYSPTQSVKGSYRIMYLWMKKEYRSGVR